MSEVVLRLILTADNSNLQLQLAADEQHPFNKIINLLYFAQRFPAV